MAHYRITQIEDYEPLTGSENIERICEKARKLKGLRVGNFNSTYYEGAWPRRVLQKIAHTVLVNGSSATSNSISVFFDAFDENVSLQNKIGWSRPFRVRATRQLICFSVESTELLAFGSPDHAAGNAGSRVAGWL